MPSSWSCRWLFFTSQCLSMLYACTDLDGKNQYSRFMSKENAWRFFMSCQLQVTGFPIPNFVLRFGWLSYFLIQGSALRRKFTCYLGMRMSAFSDDLWQLHMQNACWCKWYATWPQNQFRWSRRADDMKISCRILFPRDKLTDVCLFRPVCRSLGKAMLIVKLLVPVIGKAERNKSLDMHISGCISDPRDNEPLPIVSYRIEWRDTVSTRQSARPEPAYRVFAESRKSRWTCIR